MWFVFKRSASKFNAPFYIQRELAKTFITIPNAIPCRSERRARAAHAQPSRGGREKRMAAAAARAKRVSGLAGARASGKRLSTFEMKLKAKAKVYFFLACFYFHFAVSFRFFSFDILAFFALCCQQFFKFLLPYNLV